MGIDFLLRWSPIPSLLVDVQGKDTKIWLVLDWKSTMDLGGDPVMKAEVFAEVVWCVATEWCFKPIVVYDQSCIGTRGQTNSGMRGKPIWDSWEESCPPFRVLRHRTPSSPTYLSEVLRKPFALSRVFLLSSGGKSILLVKKKAPSRSGFSASMHVVLKTMHVNLNIHVRRY